MRFYESQLDDVKKKQHFGSIEDRLLILTVQHTRDAYLKSELLKWRIPPIVPRIYEKRKLWKEAMEYYRLANVSDEERKANLSRFNVDNRLFEELSKLSAGQQRQVLALSRMVVRVEPLLREYVRKRVKRRENWQADLEKVFPVSRKRQKGHEEFQLTLEETERRDILDWLTLPELLSLVVHPDYWPIFHENFSNQSEWMGLSNLIRIRNNLAHSIPLSSQQVDYCLTITDRILKLIS